MDETKAAAILSALAQGVNPSTGELFAPDSPYQQADVVRALYVALGRLQRPAEHTREAVESRARGTARSNVGKPWSAADDQRLLAEYERGRTPAELARDLGRTLAGVEARLEKHGRLSSSERKTTNRFPRGSSASDQVPS